MNKTGKVSASSFRALCSDKPLRRGKMGPFLITYYCKVFLRHSKLPAPPRLFSLAELYSTWLISVHQFPICRRSHRSALIEIFASALFILDLGEFANLVANVTGTRSQRFGVGWVDSGPFGYPLL